MDSKPRVVVHMDANGNLDFMADGDVDLFTVDERVPRDRVYQMSNHRVAPERIDELFGTSRIGRLGDMPVTEAAIRALLDGEPVPPKPPLTLV